MNLRHLYEVVAEIGANTPEPIRAALASVDVVICLKPFGSMPSDIRGMYDGDFSSSTDDEGENHEPPVGTIYLVAANLADKADARTVFLHEIGHALGLDEHEVAGLGL